MQGLGGARQAASTGGGLEGAQGLHRRKTISHALPTCENDSHYIGKQIVCPRWPPPLDFASQRTTAHGDRKCKFGSHLSICFSNPARPSLCPPSPELACGSSTARYG